MTKLKFKIGDSVKIKNYNTYDNFREHKGKTATITRFTGSETYPYDITWKGTTDTCAASEKELIKIIGKIDWQERVTK